MNKKINLILIITFIALIFSMSSAMAVDIPSNIGEVGEGGLFRNTIDAGRAAGFDTDKHPGTALATLAGTIVSAFLSLLGIIFITYTLYGGYLWMTAGGSEEKVTKAKAIIRNGIIGMIVIFSVWGIYLVVAAIFNPNIESFSTGGY